MRRNLSPPNNPSPGSYERVADLASLPPQGLLGVRLGDGTGVCLVRSAVGVYALKDECTHAAYPLSDGDLDGTCLECPLHGAQFDIRTGDATSPPAVEAVVRYAVEVRDGGVWVGDPLPKSD